MSLGVQCDDNLLYHYTTADAAIKYILFNRRLRLSPLSTVNDLKEAKTPVIPWTPSNDFEGIHMKQTIVKSMFEKYTKIICFSQDRIVMDEVIKGYNLPTMWAHYGDCNKGICLVFKKDVILEQIEKVIPLENIYKGNVKYDNDISTNIKEFRKFKLDDFKSDTVKEIYKEYSENIFREVVPYYMIKRIDWDTESEYRIIINKYEEGYTYFDFGDALHEIIIGNGIANNTKDYSDLIGYEKEYNVQLHGMNWNCGIGEKLKIGINI